MRITIIQFDIKWSDKDFNLKKIESMIPENTDLIVLPEMFSTGFVTNELAKDLAEDMDGRTINWMKSISKSKNIAITGSLIIKDSEKIFNRLIWVHPSGEIEFYDKKHLFSFAGEDKVFTPGKDQLIVEYAGFKIKPLICYDLRFPVWSSSGEFDMIIYVANWPKSREHHWSSLLVSRAIENQCFVVGVNRVGEDDSKKKHSGLSQIVNPNGEILTILINEGLDTTYLDKDELNDFRSKLPFLKDSDRFEILS